MTEEKTHFEFPCLFPIKVMGDREFDLKDFVKKTLEQHVKDHNSIQILARESSGGKYISVTATFMAESKDQLNTIYQIFHKHKHVKMVL
ncbi:MAG: hypothetical protein K0S29_1074 [Gammaproteobacteria bacterium]|jgi:putative lipoic acid-binding regulatory protein|nr:hypothetical protein [Gammaproteobacteria bacterium]